MALPEPADAPQAVPKPGTMTVAALPDDIAALHARKQKLAEEREQRLAAAEAEFAARKAAIEAEHRAAVSEIDARMLAICLAKVKQPNEAQQRTKPVPYQPESISAPAAESVQTADGGLGHPEAAEHQRLAEDADGQHAVSAEFEDDDMDDGGSVDLDAGSDRSADLSDDDVEEEEAEHSRQAHADLHSGSDAAEAEADGSGLRSRAERSADPDSVAEDGGLCSSAERSADLTTADCAHADLQSVHFGTPAARQEDEDPGDVREEVTSPFRGHSQQPAASGNPAPQQRSLNRERKATGKFPKRVVPQSIHSQPAATAAASALSPAQQPADADGAMPLPGGPSTASVQANSHLEGRGAAPLPGGPEAAAVVEEGPSEAAAAAPALPEDISDTRTFFMFRASRSRSSARKLGRRIPARLWQAKGLTPPELNPPGAAAVALRTRLRPIRTNCLAVIKEADPAWWAYLLGSESRAWAEARDRQQALKNRFLPRKWPVWRREYAAAAGLMLPELLESDEESEEDVGAFGIRQGPLGDGEASRAAFDEDAGAVVLPEYGEMSGDLTSLSDSDDEDDTRRLRKKDRSGSESSGGSDLEDAESARSEPDPAELLSDALARLSARAGLPLDPDSSELAALVEAAMQQCSGLAACRSSAEQALVQRRMGETFAAIVAALEGFEQQWREKQKPALQRKAHSIWLAGRSRLGTLETWQDELRHWQQRLLNFAQEIATTHVQSGARSLKGIRRQCESLRTTFDDILEYLVKLKTCEQADAPERPEAQPVLPHRKKQRRMGTGDAVHAEGADLAEQAEGAAFIDADDEGLGSPQGRKEQLAGQKRRSGSSCEGGGRAKQQRTEHGRADANGDVNLGNDGNEGSGSEDGCSDSDEAAADAEGDVDAPRSVWNAARLQPNTTEVLVLGKHRLPAPKAAAEEAEPPDKTGGPSQPSNDLVNGQSEPSNGLQNGQSEPDGSAAQQQPGGTPADPCMPAEGSAAQQGQQQPGGTPADSPAAPGRPAEGSQQVDAGLDADPSMHLTVPDSEEEEGGEALPDASASPAVHAAAEEPSMDLSETPSSGAAAELDTNGQPELPEPASDVADGGDGADRGQSPHLNPQPTASSEDADVLLAYASSAGLPKGLPPGESATPSASQQPTAADPNDGRPHAEGVDEDMADAEAGNPNAATSPLKLPAAGLDQDEPMGIAAPHQDPVNSPQAMQQLSSPAETGSRDGRARTAKPLDPVLVTRSPSDDVEDIDIVAVADLSPGAVVEVHVSCSQHAGRSRPIWRRAHLLRQTADSSVVAFLEEPDQEVSKPRSHIRPIPPNSAFITEPSALQWGRVIETIINPDPPRASWCGVVACTVPAVWTDKASAPGSKSGHAPGVRIGQVVDLLNKRRSHPAEPPHSEQVIAHMSVQASDTLFSITAGMLASQRVRRPQEWDRTRSMWLDSSFTADELASLYRAVRPTFKGETIVRPADKRRDEAAVGWLSEQAEAAGMDNTQVLPEGLQNAFVRKYLACRPCAKFAKAFKRMAPAPKKPRLPSKGDWAAADAGRAPPTPRKRAAHRDTAEDPLLLELRAAGAGLFGGGAASRRKAKAPSKKRAGVLLGEDGEELPSVRAAKKRQERADKMDQLTTRAAERRNKRQSLTNTAARNMVLSQGHEQAGHDSKAQPLQEGDSKVLVAGSIAKALKPHQWEGMRFLWRNIVENHLVDDDGEDPGGCILAHSMGLGKSIQTIAFLHTYHTYIKGERTIIVAPANVLHNWKDEFKRWLPPPSANVSEIALDKVFVCDKKQEGVREWHHVGGGAVLIISFQRFAGMATKRAAGKAGRDRPRLTPKEEDGAINPSVADRKAQEEAKRAAEEAELCGMLLNGASVVIADEAHEIKNRETLINSALNRIKTAKRIALTGYPLQNKLDEYYTMICWVKDDLMGDARDFHETFTNPITAGQKKDSSAAERREMAKNLSVLHDLTSDFIHRKGPELLQLELPPKLDHVLLLRLHPLQSKLYAKYIKLSAGGRDLFRDAGMLHKLCDQPADFLAKLRDVVSGKPVELDFATDADADGDGKPDQVPVVIPSSAADVGMDEAGILDPAPSSSCGAASRPLVTAQQPGGAVNNSHGGAGTGQENHGTSEASASGEPQQKAGAGKKRGRKAKGAKETKVTKPFSAVMAQELLKVADAELNGQPLGTLISPKAAVITQLLQICRERGDRLVVFSQWLETLNDIEQTLQQLLGWRKEREYLRLDGHTNSKKRQADINNFNRRDSPAQVYLLSTKAGSLGINLTTACRMVIFDEPWNPVHNAQAIARIYRYGQTQPTYVYRLLYKSAIDQRVYRRNVDKEGLFKRVVDNKTVKGMNSLEDIDIYAYEEPAAPAPVHILGLAESTSDEALARMLRADMAKDAWIADVEDHRKNLPEDPTQVLTMLEKVQAARQFAEKETATDKCRAPTGKPVKNKRLLRLAKVYKEDTALEQAEQKALAELQDDDDQPGPSTAPAAANHGIVLSNLLATASGQPSSAAEPTAQMHVLSMMAEQLVASGGGMGVVGTGAAASAANTGRQPASANTTTAARSHTAPCGANGAASTAGNAGQPSSSSAALAAHSNPAPYGANGAAPAAAAGTAGQPSSSRAALAAHSNTVPYGATAAAAAGTAGQPSSSRAACAAHSNPTPYGPTAAAALAAAAAVAAAKRASNAALVALSISLPPAQPSAPHASTPLRTGSTPAAVQSSVRPPVSQPSASLPRQTPSMPAAAQSAVPPLAAGSSAQRAAPAQQGTPSRLPTPHGTPQPFTIVAPPAPQAPSSRAAHPQGTPSQPRETVSQAPANRAATPQGVPHRVPSAVKPSTSAAGGIPLLPGADPAAVLARQLSADARSQQLKAAAKPSEHAGGSLGDLVAGGGVARTGTTASTVTESPRAIALRFLGVATSAVASDRSVWAGKAVERHCVAAAGGTSAASEAGAHVSVAPATATSTPVTAAAAASAARVAASTAHAAGTAGAAAPQPVLANGGSSPGGLLSPSKAVGMRQMRQAMRQLSDTEPHFPAAQPRQAPSIPPEAAAPNAFSGSSCSGPAQQPPSSAQHSASGNTPQGATASSATRGESCQQGALQNAMHDIALRTANGGTPPNVRALPQAPSASGAAAERATKSPELPGGADKSADTPIAAAASAGPAARTLSPAQQLAFAASLPRDTHGTAAGASQPVLAFAAGLSRDIHGKAAGASQPVVGSAPHAAPPSQAGGQAAAVVKGGGIYVRPGLATALTSSGSAQQAQHSRPHAAPAGSSSSGSGLRAQQAQQAQHGIGPAARLTTAAASSGSSGSGSVLSATARAQRKQVRQQAQQQPVGGHGTPAAATHHRLAQEIQRFQQQRMQQPQQPQQPQQALHRGVLAAAATPAAQQRVQQAQQAVGPIHAAATGGNLLSSIVSQINGSSRQADPNPGQRSSAALSPSLQPHIPAHLAGLEARQPAATQRPAGETQAAGTETAVTKAAEKPAAVTPSLQPHVPALLAGVEARKPDPNRRPEALTPISPLLMPGLSTGAGARTQPASQTGPSTAGRAAPVAAIGAGQGATATPSTAAQSRPNVPNAQQPPPESGGPVHETLADRIKRSRGRSVSPSPSQGSLPSQPADFSGSEASSLGKRRRRQATSAPHGEGGSSGAQPNLQDQALLALGRQLLQSGPPTAGNASAQHAQQPSSATQGAPLLSNGTVLQEHAQHAGQRAQRATPKPAKPGSQSPGVSSDSDSDAPLRQRPKTQHTSARHRLAHTTSRQEMTPHSLQHSGALAQERPANRQSPSPAPTAPLGESDDDETWLRKQSQRDACGASQGPIKQSPGGAFGASQGPSGQPMQPGPESDEPTFVSQTMMLREDKDGVIDLT